MVSSTQLIPRQKFKHWKTHHEEQSFENGHVTREKYAQSQVTPTRRGEAKVLRKLRWSFCLTYNVPTIMYIIYIVQAQVQCIVNLNDHTVCNTAHAKLHANPFNHTLKHHNPNACKL